MNKIDIRNIMKYLLLVSLAIGISACGDKKESEVEKISHEVENR